MKHRKVVKSKDVISFLTMSFRGGDGVMDFTRQLKQKKVYPFRMKL